MSTITSVSTFLFKPFDQVLTLKRDLSWLSSWGGGECVKRKNTPPPNSSKHLNNGSLLWPRFRTAIQELEECEKSLLMLRLLCNPLFTCIWKPSSGPRPCSYLQHRLGFVDWGGSGTWPLCFHCCPYVEKIFLLSMVSIL